MPNPSEPSLKNNSEPGEKLYNLDKEHSDETLQHTDA
jgi:hypothetical protein